MRNEGDQWWIERCRAIEKATTIGNSRNPYWMIRNTGACKLSASEMIKEPDGSLIHSQELRLELRQNTSQSTLIGELLWWSTQLYLKAKNAGRYRSSIRKWRSSRRWNFSKDTGQSDRFLRTAAVFTQELTKLGSMWAGKEILKEWGKTMIVPIDKKSDESTWSNHTDTSLVSIAFKVLSNIILHRLHSIRKGLWVIIKPL